MKKKIGIGIIAVLVIGIVVGTFYYVSNRDHTAVDGAVETTEIGQLITKNLDTTYPASPRAVVNLYSRMLACMYNQEYTDEEFEQLMDQMYILMDEELKAENPIDTFYENMKTDAQSYKDKNWRISNYTIPDTDEVTYDTIDDNEFAVLTASYFVRQDTSYAKTYQDFMLRKDEDGKWKIYGYQLTKTEEVTEEEAE